jgi:iron complex outermembrane receptor protein
MTQLNDSAKRKCNSLFRPFISMLVLMFSAWSLAAQTGAIKGIVETADGNPAQFVQVKIKGSNLITETDDKGTFEFKKVKPGNYMLIASVAGMKPQETSLEVSDGETNDVSFELTENTNQLQEIAIVAHAHKNESGYVAKMPMKDIENPQVYNMVSADLLTRQAITNYDDALNNVPGIHKLWESTGRGGDGASYYSLRGFEAQATVINGVPGLTNGSLDPANIERIEVLKGPSSTLFGSSLVSYGGLINTVTKKPYDHFGGEITYNTGSFGLNRITADINAPVTDGLSIRTNAAFHSENSFQDAGFRKSIFLAPSMSYKVNDRLTFLLNTEFIQQESTNPTMLFLGRNSPLQWKDLNELNYNNKLSLTSDDLYTKNPRYNIQAQMLYKLAPGWQSQTVLSRGHSGATGYYSYLYDNENGRKDFGLWITDQNAYTNTLDIQQNVTGDFKIGNMRNRLVVGLDFFERRSMSGGSGWARMYNVNAQGEVNYLDPYGDDTLAPVYLTKSSVDNLLANTSPYVTNTKDATYSAYASDVINIRKNLLAMASLRVDYFDNRGDVTTEDGKYHQAALSPKFGVVYQPIENKIALFANYMNGFKNIATQTVQGLGAKTFEPEHANQMEFGLKTNLFSDKLNATVSYYDIRVKNVVIGGTFNEFSTQGGEVESKGVELDLNAHPVKGLSLIAGFSYNDSKIIQGDSANVWLETGRRPIYSGPKTMVNFWASYDFSGPLKGFGLGFGGNYSSELLILDSKVTGTFALPSYMVMNAAVSYTMNKFRFGLNLNNFTNKEYYTGYSTVNPQRPRNFVASIAFKF